jgi:hypothetical protein
MTIYKCNKCSKKFRNEKFYKKHINNRFKCFHLYKLENKISLSACDDLYKRLLEKIINIENNISPKLS